jgi:hypothetical protein
MLSTKSQYELDPKKLSPSQAVLLQSIEDALRLQGLQIKAAAAGRRRKTNEYEPLGTDALAADQSSGEHLPSTLSIAMPRSTAQGSPAPANGTGVHQRPKGSKGHRSKSTATPSTSQTTPNPSDEEIVAAETLVGMFIEKEDEDGSDTTCNAATGVEVLLPTSQDTVAIPVPVPSTAAQHGPVCLPSFP